MFPSFLPFKMFAKKSSYLHFYFLLDKKYNKIKSQKTSIENWEFFLFYLKYVDKLFYIIT